MRKALVHEVDGPPDALLVSSVSICLAIGGVLDDLLDDGEEYPSSFCFMTPFSVALFSGVDNCSRDPRGQTIAIPI